MCTPFTCFVFGSHPNGESGRTRVFGPSIVVILPGENPSYLKDLLLPGDQKFRSYVVLLRNLYECGVQVGSGRQQRVRGGLR